MKHLVGSRAKTYSYLKDNNDEGKKAKGVKNCVIKRKPKFQDYKNCLKASQVINAVKKFRKEINVDYLREDKIKFIEKNKVVLKTQQRLKSERHNVFTEKISLGSNDHKRIQSVDSIETYAHGMSKDLIWKKEKIKRINIIKR